MEEFEPTPPPDINNELSDNFKNFKESDISPSNEIERMLVLGIKSILESEFSEKIGNSLEKFSDSQLIISNNELKKTENTSKELDIESKKIDLLSKINNLERFDRYVKFIIIVGLVFIIYTIDIIEKETFSSFLFLAIGLLIKGNWDDLKNIFAKKNN